MNILKMVMEVSIWQLFLLMKVERQTEKSMKKYEAKLKMLIWWTNDNSDDQSELDKSCF